MKSMVKILACIIVMAMAFASCKNEINGHEYVDLGLPSGLKWATCNIGADTPEAFGNYYSWGEIKTKPEYLGYNWKTNNVYMRDVSGNPNYDAATANWGSTWRMPTTAEMEELMTNCTCTEAAQNGVRGLLVTGKNGKSIFFPEAGKGGYGYISGGSYWSSTPEYGVHAYAFVFYDAVYPDSVCYLSLNYRFAGFPVRPVSD